MAKFGRLVRSGLGRAKYHRGNGGASNDEPASVATSDTASLASSHSIEAGARVLTSSRLEELEADRLTWTQIRACLIAGAGFFTDAYDLFIINIVANMLAYVYYREPTLPKNWDLAVKVATQVGTLVGQLVFGWMGDRFGRQRIYGFELMIIIIGTIMSAFSASAVHGFNVLTTLTIMRFVVGFGVGGDYPLSATITSEYASTRLRGAMTAAIFAMQGFGILASAIVSAIVIVAFKSAIEDDIDNLDLAWRLCLGIGAIPGIITVYFRLTMKETPRYQKEQARRQQALDDAQRATEALEKGPKALKSPLLSEKAPSIDDPEPASLPCAPEGSDSGGSSPPGSHQPSTNFPNEKGQTSTTSSPTAAAVASAAPVAPTGNENYWSEFAAHYRQWRYLKTLLACSGCWFCLDVAFYGINLNNGIILNAIGYSSNTSPYESLHKQSIGNIIVNLMGTVPGYWLTVFTIEKLGRKTIQAGGFFILVVLFTILGFAYHPILDASVALFIVFFTLAQLFSNFGPNTTTFVYPSEVFPTRFRSTSHGISAASGKLGAIVAQAGFSQLKDIGGKDAFVPHLLEIFALFMLIGFGLTFLLPETKGRTLEEINGEE
ncbi:hypothetical protein H4R34_002886 [Dimargaris verticillata]|uniref:Major facilitator superfamily (MFS) profile domain-containing protein n=1 Tax=Dimargaris verticillata TaxID=2761393 RepID=A0A9W8E8U8_9FUNG|nr:hypothetical protein H4R34_002886 [Dimargaris verticillata]